MAGRRESCLAIVGITGMTVRGGGVPRIGEDGVVWGTFGAELGVVRVKYWLQCLIPLYRHPY